MFGTFIVCYRISLYIIIHHTSHITHHTSHIIHRAQSYAITLDHVPSYSVLFNHMQVSFMYKIKHSEHSQIPSSFYIILHPPVVQPSTCADVTQLARLAARNSTSHNDGLSQIAHHFEIVYVYNLYNTYDDMAQVWVLPEDAFPTSNHPVQSNQPKMSGILLNLDDQERQTQCASTHPALLCSPPSVAQLAP